MSFEPQEAIRTSEPTRAAKANGAPHAAAPRSCMQLGMTTVWSSNR